MSESVNSVVGRHLCTQCGTCVAVCPVGAIEMRETPAGLLNAAVVEEECVACGECLEVCPGSSVELGLPEDVDPFRGAVCAAYVGHAHDEVVRSTGQSGGVVSALLLYLLDTDRVDAALVTAMPADGALRPKPMLARTEMEILAAQGSKYCPVATNAVLKDVAPADRIAFVGVSCQMHGIHRLTQNRNGMLADVEYRIGLFCDRTLLYTCIDQMIKDARMAREEIVGLEYRSKARNGWPGEVCFRLASGESRFFPPHMRMRLKDSFTAPRCRLCFDKMNIFSDLSVGDAWGVSESFTGDSAIIVRNQKGASLLKDACERGFLELREIDAEMIFRAQGIEQRRRHWAAYMDVWREMGRSAPEYKGIASRFVAPADAGIRAGCRRKLSLNCRVAGSQTRMSALATARNQLRVDRIKFWVARMIKSP